MNEGRAHEPPPVLELADAVERLIHDGDTVALEGFTHLIPFAAAHEIIRQGTRDLTLARMTPDVVYDQLIGAGWRAKLVFSWGGNPGVGSLHRFRDAVENGWPAPLEIDEHSHAGMANRYVAGASGLPFAVLRGYRGTDLAGPYAHGRHRRLPVHRRGAGRRRRPQPGRHGHPRPAGRPGGQRPAVGPDRGPEGGGARRPAGAGHRRGDRRHAGAPPRRRRPAHLGRRRGRVVPGGAHPSYAAGYSVRDNDFYRAWDADRAATGSASRPGSDEHVAGDGERRSEAESDGTPRTS